MFYSLGDLDRARLNGVRALGDDTYDLGEEKRFIDGTWGFLGKKQWVFAFLCKVAGGEAKRLVPDLDSYAISL